MMNIHEAIRILGDTKLLTPIGQAASVAIDALKKQIPKPPEYKVHLKYKSLGKNYYCECGVMFVDFERNGTTFCGNCGQRLK
jgi:hypothetical protein